MDRYVATATTARNQAPRNTPDIPCMFKTISTQFARRTVSQADKQCIGYRVKAKVISTHFAWQSFFEIKQGAREKRASRVERRTEHSQLCDQSLCGKQGVQSRVG